MRDEHGVTDDVKRAAAALARGQAVAFPTDTVVGLGLAVEAAEGPGLLYEIKGRYEGKPIAWLVGGEHDLVRYGRDVPRVAHELARRHWPGPLTLIVNASEAVPRAFCGADGTIGLRMPDHEAALSLIRAAGCPLATTSANVSGEPAPRTMAELDERIARRAACVLQAADAGEGGKRSSGLASTIIDCTGARPRIIREGAVTKGDVLAAERAVAQADMG